MTWQWHQVSTVLVTVYCLHKEADPESDGRGVSLIAVGEKQCATSAREPGVAVSQPTLPLPGDVH